MKKKLFYILLFANKSLNTNTIKEIHHENDIFYLLKVNIIIIYNYI